MSDQLEILRASLEKKEAKLDAMIGAHFADVRQTNGQPLNDKRGGAATMRRWEKQNDALRNQQAEIEKTQNAIEREELKRKWVDRVTETIPQPILDLIADGTLNQWKKHPNTFFVAGIDRARIVWDIKKRQIGVRYFDEVKDPEQRRRFVALFNALKEAIA